VIRNSRKTFKKMAAGAALIGAMGLVYAREIEPRWIEVKSVELTLPRLAPEFDGYRIVQIGDLHLDDWTNPAWLTRIVKLVNGQRPDLIAIMGDFASYSTRCLDAERLVGALRDLRTADGVVAVLGNHDYTTDANWIRTCLQKGGVTELSNAVHTLRRGGAELHIAGLDDLMEGHSRLDRILEELPEMGAAILLAHEPDSADASAATGRFDLQLSGHSHGGQVGVPFLRRLVLPPFSQRYVSGLYRVGDMLLYTNRGLGFIRLRLRFLCRPEITVIILRSPLAIPRSGVSSSG
jgi:predicted MPP superfamily phosphohydrolase